MSGRPVKLRTLFITVLGSGFLPTAPGTWSSLLAALLFAALWLLTLAAGAPRAALETLVGAGVVVSGWLAVRWGAWALGHFGGSDPRPFTLDEFAGQWVALLALPAAYGGDYQGLAFAVASQFLLFRVFDVFKPPPARQAERLPAGWGVLTDDLVAGAYANLVGQVLWRLTPLAAWLN